MRPLSVQDKCGPLSVKSGMVLEVEHILFFKDLRSPFV